MSWSPLSITLVKTVVIPSAFKVCLPLGDKQANIYKKLWRNINHIIISHHIES